MTTSSSAPSGSPNTTVPTSCHSDRSAPASAKCRTTPARSRSSFRPGAADSPTAPTAHPTSSSVRFAAGTDLLLIEATLPRPERTGQRGHLTPGEAGEHGRLAGAQRVVLTHFSDELDPEWARAEAIESFGGPVELAYEGAVYDV